ESTFERGMQAAKHFAPFLGAYVDQVRAADVEDWKVGLAKRSPRQAQIALALMKQVLRSAADRAHVIDQAVLGIKPPKSEERLPRFLSWLEAEELASLCSEGRLVVLACLTGLRQGELFALRDRDVHLDDGVIVVTRSASKGKAARTKTAGSVRRAYMSGLARQTMREQLV